MPPLVTQRPGFAELSDFELDPPSVRLLPRNFCRRHALVVLGRVAPGKTDPVLLGAVYPDRLPILDEAARLLGRTVEVVRLNLYEVDRALLRAHESGGLANGDEAHRVHLSEPTASTDATVPELLDAVLAEAVRAGASDIHIETWPTDVDVRLRIDGILHQRFTHINPDNISEVASRIKVLSDLDLAERRRPQDGRFRVIFLDGERQIPVDFRVSVSPSQGGEDIVLRVLNASAGLLSVAELGMIAPMQEKFSRLLANPEGLILVTGPTSSGKTTTLYSALAHMSDQHRKIITAEDPIEYQLDRINQKQVSPQMDMGALLRSMLRQNPDVVLIGEIRDQDSGNVALDAAATGHLVLSTLHTSDAIGVVTRMRGIGLDNADIAAALLASVGQRLVRRLCMSCSEPVAPTEAQRSLFGGLIEGQTLFAAPGCERCKGSGYKGRIGLYELLIVDEQTQDLIADGAARHDLRQHIAATGFRTMTDDAIEKAAAGLTTLDELVRVVPYRQIALVRQDREAGR